MKCHTALVNREMGKITKHQKRKAKPVAKPAIEPLPASESRQSTQLRVGGITASGVRDLLDAVTDSDIINDQTVRTVARRLHVTYAIAKQFTTGLSALPTLGNVPILGATTTHNMGATKTHNMGATKIHNMPELKTCRHLITQTIPCNCRAITIGLKYGSSLESSISFYYNHKCISLPYTHNLPIHALWGKKERKINYADSPTYQHTRHPP